VEESELDGQYLLDDAEHDTQVDEDNAPKVVEYLPTGQAIHSAEPVWLVYLPAAHSLQLLDEAEDENDPAEQELQDEAVEAPVAAEYVLASQLVQTVDPAYTYILYHTTLRKLHIYIHVYPYVHI
jgi:hypothetical protein